MKDPGVLQAEATQRYLTDPEFHAKVRVAASLTEWTARKEGVSLSMGQRQSITQAAAYGLLMAEHELDQNTIDDAYATMAKTANNLGMSVIRVEDLDG